MSDVTPGFDGEEPSASSFLLEIDGVSIGLFSKVSGLEVSIEVVPYKEGGVNGYEHHFPGRMSWPNVTLSRGVTNNDALFQWMSQSSGPGFAANGNKLARKTCAITALASFADPSQGAPKRLRTYSLTDVFPVRWKGPSFDVGSSEALVEELELAHNGFTSSTPSAT